MNKLIKTIDNWGDVDALHEAWRQDNPTQNDALSLIEKTKNMAPPWGGCHFVVFIVAWHHEVIPPDRLVDCVKLYIEKGGYIINPTEIEKYNNPQAQELLWDSYNHNRIFRELPGAQMSKGTDEGAARCLKLIEDIRQQKEAERNRKHWMIEPIQYGPIYCRWCQIGKPMARFDCDIEKNNDLIGRLIVKCSCGHIIENRSYSLTTKLLPLRVEAYIP